MPISRKLLGALAITFVSTFGVYTNHAAAGDTDVRVLADTNLLKNFGVKIDSLSADKSLGVATLSEYQAQTLSHFAHKFGKCGGFEALSPDESTAQVLQSVETANAANFQSQSLSPMAPLVIEKKAWVETAVSHISEDNLRSTVEWLSSFQSRYHKSADRDKHVLALKERLAEMLKNYSGKYQIETIAHRSTPQSSLHLRLEGESSTEVVVLGAHLDSIANYGRGSRAPGADDNASGSSNLIEILRVIAETGKKPARHIDFFWYAGEEAGLLGSAEIAKTYKASQTQVIGVLQLDMTLFPGAGELVIGDMTDFTTPWLRDLMSQMNTHYVGAKLVEDECGYGCSDHASWFRQGYATIMPFESTFSGMNSHIHTEKDVISPAMNFKHSAGFAKLGLAFALELAMTTDVKPSNLHL